MSPLNLKDIKLDNLSQVTVASSDSNVDRGYGRRFTVKLGNDSQEVVFKDLYKTARRLMKEAKESSSSKGMSEVSEFITKLEGVENQAIGVYAGRGNWYKFRSWFHRLFGGAFLGSHIDRLAKLNNKALDKVAEFKEREELGKIKGICDNRDELTRSIQLVSDYSNMNFTLGESGKEINVRFKNNTLWIQEKSLAGTDRGLLEVDVGSYAIKFEGTDKDSIPEEVKPIFNAIVCQVLKVSSSYTENLSVSHFNPNANTDIELRREGLDVIPEWHLKQFCSFKHEDFKVKYTDEKGADYGGLKREYVGKLASNIAGREALFVEADGSLKIPRVLGASRDAVLYCNDKDKETYQNLGTLFARCYKSSPSGGTYEENLITTGRLFSDAVFKAAFTLSEDDLGTSSALLQDTQIRMAKTILTHLNKDSSDAVSNMIKCFDLLDVNNLDQVSSDTIWFAFAMLPESVREAYEDENFDPDFEKIKANEDQFKADLFKALMQDSTSIDELNGTPLGSMIDPIYQMAKGMQAEITNWDALRTGAVDAFSTKVQGTINRALVIASIEESSIWGSNDILRQKITWLKEWINEASDSQVQAFLKFATGSTSLIGSSKIGIDGYKHTPFIEASTCNMRLHMSSKVRYDNWGRDQWDDTKEGFVRNLESAINVEGFQVL